MGSQRVEHGLETEQQQGPQQTAWGLAGWGWGGVERLADEVRGRWSQTLHGSARHMKD